MKNKGLLGIILMHATDHDYATVQEWVDYIEAYCRRHGYTISVEKLDNPKP